jgi:hypothetical protein
LHTGDAAHRIRPAKGLHCASLPTRDFTLSEPFHGLRRFGVAGFLLDKLA